MATDPAGTSPVTEEAAQAGALAFMRKLAEELPLALSESNLGGLASAWAAGLFAAAPLIRAQAFTEAADAIEAERMPDPPTEEMRSRVDYWRGYDAAIFDAGEALRGLGEETENA